MNNNGFTLIEIIASIAILGMVIAVLLPIFPQILSWNEKTEQELVASNLLGQIVSDVQNTSKNREIISQLRSSRTCNEGWLDITTLGDIANYDLNDVTYSVSLRVCKEQDVNLYRAHIIVYSGNRALGETYTYINDAGDSIE
jgi:prepilin-type N-terminal cleavage/methylation domain-containing protein